MDLYRNDPIGKAQLIKDIKPILMKIEWELTDVEYIYDHDNGIEIVVLSYQNDYKRTVNVHGNSLCATLHAVSERMY